MCNLSVELLLGILVVVTLPRHPNPDTLGDVPDSHAPDMFVQLGVDPDVTGLHRLHHELLDLTDRSWSSLLEGDSHDPLRHMHRALPGDDVGLDLGLFLLVDHGDDLG